MPCINKTKEYQTPSDCRTPTERLNESEDTRLSKRYALFQGMTCIEECIGFPEAQVQMAKLLEGHQWKQAVKFATTYFKDHQADVKLLIEYADKLQERNLPVWYRH
ncbi:MAG: hypothetical protein ACD_73C00208G0002 [uncultured bacterium]|nr:MAG: hypothetical protein ACD_73C00208G0002 [uncultured bacterium]